MITTGPWSAKASNIKIVGRWVCLWCSVGAWRIEAREDTKRNERNTEIFTIKNAQWLYTMIKSCAELKKKIFVLQRNWLKENNKMGVKTGLKQYFKKRKENKYQSYTHKHTHIQKCVQTWRANTNKDKIEKGVSRNAATL